MVADVQRHKEVVANAVLAVLARGRRVWIIQVAAIRSGEVTCPLLAGLTGWRVEHRKLILLASNHQTTEYQTIS